jgi:hypothetical protein
MEDMTARAQSLSEMATNMQVSVSQFTIGEEKETSPPVVRQKGTGLPLSGSGLRSREKAEAKVPEKVKIALDRRGFGTEPKGKA